MATNQIGTGTVNLSINMPTDERGALGRAAFRAGASSVGNYVKRLILLGAEAADPAAAMELRAIRVRYYGAALTSLILCLTFHAWFVREEPPLRRQCGRVRCVRTQRGRELEVIA